MTDKIRLGISACLIGEKVRYDGSHKRHDRLINTLEPLVEFVPVCPEKECGLPVPRETCDLHGENPENPRMITTHTRIDLTSRMAAWTEERLRSLEKEDLCGFIFKSRSPSCGLTDVNLFDSKGIPIPTGTGLFAMEFREHFPDLPVTEEIQLDGTDDLAGFVENLLTIKKRQES